jgi:hypothetical protein
MPSLVFDDHGTVWDTRSLALRLRASIDARDLREFAVLNLGYVSLTQVGQSALIHLRPALAKPAALGALYLWLHQRGAERLLVNWYNGRWHSEIIGWNRGGWSRVTSLLEQPEARQQRFSRGEIAPNLLGLQNPLRHLLDDASRLAKVLEDPKQKLPWPLNERFILLTEDLGGELRVCDFGRSMMVRSKQWQSKAKGLRVDDLPDWSYGRWVGEAYRQALRSGQPLLESVAATIEWPEHGTLSHSYWRLILPDVARGRPARLLGVTLDNAGAGRNKVA